MIPSVLEGRTIRCILFDLGETLWRRKESVTWQSYVQRGNQRVAALLQRHFDPQALPAADVAFLSQQINQAVIDQVAVNFRARPEYEPDFALLIGSVLQQIGFPPVEHAVVEEIFEALRIRSVEACELYADVLPTLAELHRRGFLLGVVTNRWHGGKPFLEDMQALGLLDYFAIEHIAISADLGIRKPNAAIFMHTLNALGVSPEEAVMVGDSLRADIIGAKQLNLFAVWKPALWVRDKVRQEISTEKGIDAALLAYGKARVTERASSYQQALDGIHPDLIIEHVSDLLKVFTKAGEQ
jgi:HAD superfamily hydrolase (TIGR01549 family)